MCSGACKTPFPTSQSSWCCHSINRTVWAQKMLIWVWAVVEGSTSPGGNRTFLLFYRFSNPTTHCSSWHSHAHRRNLLLQIIFPTPSHKSPSRTFSPKGQINTTNSPPAAVWSLWEVRQTLLAALHAPSIMSKICNDHTSFLNVQYFIKAFILYMNYCY